MRQLLSLASALVMVAVLAPSAQADLAVAPWTGGGSGTTTVVANGSSGPGQLTYDNPGAYSGNWYFRGVASASGPVTLDWSWSGFHSYFAVRAALDAFVDDGTTSTTTSLVSEGPANCCASPSNGFSYSGQVTLVVQVGDTYGFQLSGSHFDSAQQMSGSLTVDQPNSPPTCSAATPTSAVIWPPNHRMVDVGVDGVTDPDGDAVTITMDGIFQDEPVNGVGDGNTAPDGDGLGSESATVRAERAGGGNGRVYHIDYSADDGNGGTCDGTVQVSVPRSQGAKGAAVDDGPLHDSTVS